VMFCMALCLVRWQLYGWCIFMGEFYSGRGGARQGAGRPKGSLNVTHVDRKQRQYRASDEEHELVKSFLAILRRDKEKAERFLTELETCQ